MGALRLCLALLVATAHLAAVVNLPPRFTGHAVLAVRLFFVLSGFYMALVLSGRRYARPWDFYVSRLLKLLPIYWLVSGLTFVAAAAATAAGHAFFPLCDPIAIWRQLHLADLPVIAAYVIGTLATLLGADTWTWFGFSSVTGAWSIAPTYGPAATSALALAGVPQAWTLGLELWFYLLAPFLVRLRTPWLIALIAASVALRLWAAPAAPYDRSLFPLELAFFLAGILLFRWNPALAPPAGRLDAELGALSYPAYVSQFLVFGILWRTPALALPWWAALPIALASLVAFSFALDRLVARPVDALRVRFGARARPRPVRTAVGAGHESRPAPHRP